MLISNLKLLLRFNSTSLFEEVSQTNALVQGDSLIPIVSDNGYHMQNDQFLIGSGLSSNGYNLDISNAMTLGFWLYPVDDGISVNEETGETSSIEKPLLDFVFDGSVLSSVFKVTEHTSENSGNYVKINIGDGVYEASSENFLASQWHYLWIVYSSTALSIYVDGVLHVLQNETGTLPSSMGMSNSNLYINYSLDGYSWNVAKNTGIIDDIFVFNTSDLNEKNIQMAINDGIKFVVDDVYTTTNIDKKSIYFNDPVTITIKSLVDDMNYVFVGRNDGKILRGSPLLWEVRKVFSEQEEIEKLGFVYDEDDNGFLKINNNTVRL